MLSEYVYTGQAKILPDYGGKKFLLARYGYIQRSITNIQFHQPDITPEIITLKIVCKNLFQICHIFNQIVNDTKSNYVTSKL